ncbi:MULTISPECIES: four helix bundle protein [unclassified Tenacibaculum]|uniref:four helix bundle protein n=1 Tax=unclassified Tenacibaculum TaxID=2635139 RepID=UPI00237AA93C|nr:four helix bundle protein [Tenacibaculum sp. L6]MDE0536880.1 four helix bundle protein [Tenacibaculum sp. L6]
MRDFRKYDIWQDAISLIDVVYDVVSRFPETEKFSLSTQIIRAAVSIPSNIAEGSSRESEKDFARFLQIALGSCFELETQIIIAMRRNYMNQESGDNIVMKIQSIQKRINGLKRKLKK